MPPAQATTLRRAKAQYKKSGSPIAPAEQRRLARALELDRRVQATKERDKRRKQAEKARVDREEKEKTARKQLGIGLATQLVGYSLTQKQMKSGMEGWLGVSGGGGGGGEKKRKRAEDDEVGEKENRNEAGAGSSAMPTAVAGMADDSFGSNMSLDEVLLGQLESGAIREDAKTASVDAEATARSHATPAHDSARQNQPTSVDVLGEDAEAPPTKRAKTMSSPSDSWAQFVDENTQILQEKSQSSPPPEARADPTVALPPMSTQDLELDSDDLIETGLPKTANPTLSPKDGVIVRDFAYFEHAKSGSLTLKVPGAPALSRKSRTERSILRSFGRKPTIATPSPKMTATCAAFTAAQCSFTTGYHHYGLSTQLLQQAIDDGDDDTEDEDEEVYSQALENSKIPDSVLMPPPPMTLSPKVFKPSAKTNLFGGKGGLQIFGLSTQLLNDAISTDDDDDDDDVKTGEDEDDALFSIPINRSVATADATEETMGPTGGEQASSGFRDFGLSTQVLQDAALDDIELTDDEDTQGS